MKEQDDILEYGYISGLIDSLEERKKELAAAIKQRLQVGESGVAGPYIVTRREVHIHPIVAKVEIRKEGKIGRVYYPAPYMTDYI